MTASNTVPSPEGKAPIAQLMTFEGEIDDNGVRWPRVLRIAENGRPYFELALAMLRAPSRPDTALTLPACAVPTGSSRVTGD